MISKNRAKPVIPISYISAKSTSRRVEFLKRVTYRIYCTSIPAVMAPE